MKLARVGLFVLLGALACAGAGGGAYLKLQADAEAARDARIAALEATLADVRARPTLTPAEACAVAEHHLLTRALDRALVATCHADATFEARGPSAGRLVGMVHGRDLDNALFGGGFGPTWCLARTASGWEVVGDDFRVPDCVVDVSAGDAAAIAEAAKDTEAGRQRAVAFDTIEAVRDALTAGGTPPDSCGEAPPERTTVTMTTAALAAHAPEGFERSFGYGTSGCAAVTDDAVAASGDAAVAEALRGSCALSERPARVLLVDILEAPPVSEGPDTFSGGRFDATLRLVDLTAGRVLCARPVSFALPETVLTLKSGTVRSEYDRGVKRAVCDGVAALGGARLDPWWGC